MAVHSVPVYQAECDHCAKLFDDYGDSFAALTPREAIVEAVADHGWQLTPNQPLLDGSTGDLLLCPDCSHATTPQVPDPQHDPNELIPSQVRVPTQRRHLQIVHSEFTGSPQ